MTGHAWPLTLKRRKNLGPKRTGQIQNVCDKAQQGGRLSGSVSCLSPAHEERRGQLRLSLTNTYHEWPDKGVSRQVDGPIRMQAGSARYRNDSLRILMTVCAHSGSASQAESLERHSAARDKL